MKQIAPDTVAKIINANVSTKYLHYVRNSVITDLANYFKSIDDNFDIDLFIETCLKGKETATFVP